MMRLALAFAKSVFCAILVTYFSDASAQDAKFYADKAGEYLRNMNYDLAISNYTTAIGLDPGYSYAYASRGSAYSRKNQFDLAIRDYNKAISLNPNYSFAYADRGYAFAQTNRVDLAIQDFTRAIGLDVNNSFAYANRGYSYSLKNLFDQAIQDYNKAISLDPGYGWAYACRGLIYLRKNQSDLAIQDFTKAIEIDPVHAGNYNNRGLCYNSLGEYELAVQDYKTCLAKTPDNSITYINIISPLVRLERFDEAISFYNEYKKRRLTSFLETDRFKFYIHFINAVSSLVNGKFENAVNSLLDADEEYGTEVKDETKRSYIDILFLLGFIYENAEEEEEARLIYEQSLTIDRNQPDLVEALNRIDNKITADLKTDKTAPEIELITPASSDTIALAPGMSKTKVVGHAKDPSGISVVKINEVPVMKVEDGGLFIAETVLKPGSNKLVISATDNQGNTSSQTITVQGIEASTRGGKVESKPETDITHTPQGVTKYYAIFIANEDYNDKDWEDLKNPVNDARRLKVVLEKNYLFDPANIDTLFNRSRVDILTTIQKRAKSLNPADNLLIFYAGHGKAITNDDKSVDGYLIPSDGTNDFPTWISIFDLKSVIKTPVDKPGSKHILIIADACFSGALTRGSLANAEEGIQRLNSKKSRTAMTSGNLTTVPDNSKFIEELIKSLNNNREKYLTAQQLFDDFKVTVRRNTTTDPLYRAIQDVGDEGGEFIFIRR